MISPNAFWRMLAVDLRFGTREVAGRFGVAVLLLAFFTALFRFLTLDDSGNFAALGFIDCFANLFGGISEFSPQYGTRFDMPASWLCVCLMGAFIVLSYPTQNLESIGIKQCIEAQGRWCWWVSKCLWTVACTFLYWLLAVVIALLASNDPSEYPTLSPTTVNLLGFFAAGDCAAYNGTKELLIFVAGIPFVLSALYLIQLAVSINTNPLIAFVVTISLLFYSAFYLNGLLPGNYLMLARSDLVIHNGVDAVSGIVLAIALGACAVLIGGKAFARHDLLGRERYSR